MKRLKASIITSFSPLMAIFLSSTHMMAAHPLIEPCSQNLQQTQGDSLNRYQQKFCHYKDLDQIFVELSGLRILFTKLDLGNLMIPPRFSIQVGTIDKKEGHRFDPNELNIIDMNGNQVFVFRQHEYLGSKISTPPRSLTILPGATVELFYTLSSGIKLPITIYYFEKPILTINR